MRSGAKRNVSLHTPRNTVYFVCKSCGKTEQEASLSSSNASSKAGSPLPKRTKILGKMNRSTAQHSSEAPKWTNHAKHVFVDLMYEQVLKGNIYTTSFSLLVWSDLRSSLFEHTALMFEVEQLKGKHNRFKDIWKKYQELMLLDTGIGWNPEANVPHAEPIIWEALAKSNPAATELRYKSFAHYQKLDVVFAGRSATGANARASTQRPTTSRPHTFSNTDDDDMDLGSPSAQNPTPSTQRITYSGSKRKAPEPNALDKIVERIDLANAAIAEKAAKKEAYSIKKVIDLLNTFDELYPMQYNCALDHFTNEVNRRIFMYLTKERQKHYIEHIIRKNMR